ncbi:MAG: insulinase family protein, partial [Lentisphaerae bacterium]|nr:insulinase family protein [Lentisphaerota bacterium]
MISRKTTAVSVMFWSLACALPPLLGAAPPPPEPEAVLRESNSRLRRFAMENGMIGLVKEDHSAPFVSVQIWTAQGAIHEGDLAGSGITHAIEHMIFKGTPTLPPGDITRRIDDAGGVIN